MGFVGFLLIALTLLATIRFSVFSFANSAALLVHNACLNRLPRHADAYAELKALVCGENFSDAATSSLYVATGLIHLFVVSGAHLIAIENLLLKLFKQFQWAGVSVLFFLIIYAFACNLNPPVTRALIAIFAGLFTLKNHLRWPENFKILIIGLLTLAFNPTWITSVSLQLSWLAALIVSIHSLYFLNKNLLFKQSLFFFALAPLLVFFQMPNPVTIFMNLIFPPILEFILFPLGLLVWFAPPLHLLFDLVIAALRFILQASEIQIYAPLNLKSDYLIYVGWSLIFTLQFYLHFKEMDHRMDHYV